MELEIDAIAYDWGGVFEVVIRKHLLDVLVISTLSVVNLIANSSLDIFVRAESKHRVICAYNRLYTFISS